MFTCPNCQREFTKRGAFTMHSRACEIKAGSPSGPIPMEQGTSAPPDLTPVIVQAIQPYIDQKFRELQESLGKAIGEQIGTAASILAERAEAELAKRMQANPQGNPLAQAFMGKLLGVGGGGGGDFLEQAARIGQAFGAVLQPIAAIQSQAFGNALRLIDLAQKFPGMTESEKTGAITDMSKPPLPGTPSTRESEAK